MGPLLSVGIPAYNRPEGLERAVRSVLGQTLSDLEVVVSDDASPDAEVARAGERLALDDARVRFVRQPRNLGHVGNYRWVLEAARGRFFMWLSDDDWLDSDYTIRCLHELRSDPRRRLVCGQARYYSDGAPVADERPIDLAARRPGARVVGYYARVNMNGPLFGVARRADLLEIPFHEVVGGDWLLVAAIAARGEVRTLPSVRVHRSMDGLGADEERLARSFGLSGPMARWHHVWVARNIWREIAVGGIGRWPARLFTATLSALIVLVRYPGVHLLRAAGLGGLEERVVGWARTRTRNTSGSSSAV
jgi:glycosyltransferase involved in cell wall biosynthesis